MQTTLQVDFGFRHAFRRPHHSSLLQCLLVSLLLVACGGGEPSTSMAIPQQSLPAPNEQLASGDAQRTARESVPADAAAMPASDAADFVQLSALSALSPLSDSEKASLLKSLRSKSPAQRQDVIGMYPSLARLTDLQKQMLLNELAQIVPTTVSQQR